MFRITYRELFEESWHVFKGNFALFLPNLFMFLVALVLGIAYFSLSGFYAFFSRTLALPDKAISEQLLVFVGQQGPWLVGLFLIYFILLLCSDIFFSLVKYGMVKDVIAHKKSLLADGFEFARTHFYSSMHIHILSVFLILLPLALIGVIVSKFFISITLLVLFGIFSFMYKMLAIFRLFFPYPVMAFERKGAYKSIRTDIHYLKTQLGHLFISWLIILGAGFIFMAEGQGEALLIIIIMISILIFEIVLSTWEQLFVIEAHLSKKRIKKRRT